MPEPRCVCPYCGHDMPEGEGGVPVVEKPAEVCRDPYCYCPSLETKSDERNTNA